MNKKNNGRGKKSVIAFNVVQGRKEKVEKNSNRENNYDKSLNLQNDAFLFAYAFGVR